MLFCGAGTYSFNTFSFMCRIQASPLCACLPSLLAVVQGGIDPDLRECVVFSSRSNAANAGNEVSYALTVGGLVSLAVVAVIVAAVIVKKVRLSVPFVLRCRAGAVGRRSKACALVG